MCHLLYPALLPPTSIGTSQGLNTSAILEHRWDREWPEWGSGGKERQRESNQHTPGFPKSPPLSLMQPWVPHLSPRLHLDENHKLTLEENLTSPAWWIKNFSPFLILDYYFWWSRLPREKTTSSYCLRIWHNHLHINWLTQATIMFAPRLLHKEEKKNTKNHWDCLSLGLW